MRNLNEGKKKSPSYMAELAEIDKQSAVVAMESKINHLQEMADKKKERLSMVSEDENLSELIDKKRVKMMEREIKEIERAKMKLEKLYEKMTGSKKKEMVDEEEKMDETYGSTTYEEDDVEEGIEDELKKNKGKTWDEAEPAQVTKEKGLAEFDLRGYLSENRLLKEAYSAFDGNPKVRQVLDNISDATTTLRKLGNEAYGGEKKNVYSSAAGGAFKAFDKALSDLDNALQSIDVKLS